jgi:hypothetical protein
VDDVLKALYGQFDPLRPLGADETWLYVDWQVDVGIEDVKNTLVNAFVRGGDQNVWRLFSGHRGVGKTTELLRVGERLAAGVGGTRFFVSMLQSEQWLDLDDIRAEDVAFQMIRQLVTDLIGRGGMSFMAAQAKGWGRRIWEWAGQTGIQVGPDWLKLSFTLKDFPGKRDEFRDLLRGQLSSLFDNVNQGLLLPAREHLAKQGIDGGIVAIVDDLDKIPLRLVGDAQATTNHEQLFLHEGRLLRSLHCDVLYTIPIELAYSHAQNELVNSFGGRILSLPVIALRDKNGRPQPAALEALRSSTGGGLPRLAPPAWTCSPRRRCWTRRSPPPVAMCAACVSPCGSCSTRSTPSPSSARLSIGSSADWGATCAVAWSRAIARSLPRSPPTAREATTPPSSACCATATCWPIRTTRATGTCPTRGWVQ